MTEELIDKIDWLNKQDKNAISNRVSSPVECLYYLEKYIEELQEYKTKN